MANSRAHKEQTRNNVYQFGGWNGSEIFKDKNCVVCNTAFKPKSGVHKFCSPQCKGKWKYITGSGSTEEQYKIISGNWYKYLSRLVNGKGRRTQISVRDLQEVLEEQDFKCALSGIPLTCILSRGFVSKTNASLDRILPGGPYTKDNVQLVCRGLNSWRSDTPLTEFIELCRKVAEYNPREKGDKVDGE